MYLRSKTALHAWRAIVPLAMVLLVGAATLPAMAQTTAQDQASATAADDQAETPALLSEEELEVLVARIALYPDDLVALVTSASLYPIDIVDAARYLEKVKSDTSLKPKESWDGSVISLLNYPEIVKMMNDDLDWTRSLGDAIANQQEEVLATIQQLRDEAVAKNIIQTDDKIKVVHEDNNVVIQSASAEQIYVPKYEPAMLYEADYAPRRVEYYPDPYPYYYYPTAPYFTGFVTGAIWGATVDWAYGGVWGGRWHGNDIDINCHKCFNNINGHVKWNDVDWRRVDRSKISFDHNQFNNINRKDFNNRMRNNVRNDVGNRANAIRHNGNNRISNHKNRVTTGDIRAAKNSNNRVKINNNINVDKSRNDNRRANVSNNNRVKHNQANVNRAKKNTNINRSKHTNVKQHANVNRNKANVNRNARRPGQTHHHGRNPSAFGDVRNGRQSHTHSTRGRQSLGNRHMGGGHRHMRRR